MSEGGVILFFFLGVFSAVAFFMISNALVLQDVKKKECVDGHYRFLVELEDETTEWRKTDLECD